MHDYDWLRIKRGELIYNNNGGRGLGHLKNK